jgi:hypothetical protein
VRDRWPPQLFLLFALAIALAWAVNDPVFSRASTGASDVAAAASQTEPPTGGQPANPDSGASGEVKPGDNAPSVKADSSSVPPGSAPATAPDSIPAAPPASAPATASDSISAAPPDSIPVSTKQPQTALPDTLQFLPPPGTATGGAAKPAEKPAVPKERVGLFGIHPIAILLGIAVLNYFIIKAATD